MKNVTGAFSGAIWCESRPVEQNPENNVGHNLLQRRGNKSSVGRRAAAAAPLSRNFIDTTEGPLFRFLVPAVGGKRANVRDEVQGTTGGEEDEEAMRLGSDAEWEIAGDEEQD